jgi:hypothetical protein
MASGYQTLGQLAILHHHGGLAAEPQGCRMQEDTQIKNSGILAAIAAVEFRTTIQEWAATCHIHLQ